MKVSISATVTTATAATLLMCAPIASAYDVNVGIDPQLGPVCQITDQSGAPSVLRAQSDAVYRFNIDLRNGFRNDLPVGVRKNFDVIDELTSGEKAVEEMSEDEFNAGQNAVANVQNSAGVAGWNQQELNVATYPLPEEQIPTLLIPQAQASQFLETDNIYEQLAESTITTNSQMSQMFSERGAAVGNKALNNLNTRLQKVSTDTDDAALRSSVQMCAEGVSAQDGAYDASPTSKLPLTGGFGNGSAAGIAGLAGIALLLVVILTAGGARLHK